MIFEIVTGKSDASHQICVQLTKTIDKLIAANPIRAVEQDKVIEKLKKQRPELIKSVISFSF